MGKNSSFSKLTQSQDKEMSSSSRTPIIQSNPFSGWSNRAKFNLQYNLAVKTLTNDIALIMNNMIWHTVNNPPPDLKHVLVWNGIHVFEAFSRRDLVGCTWFKQDGLGYNDERDDQGARYPITHWRLMPKGPKKL